MLLALRLTVCGAEDENVWGGTFVWRHLLCVFKYGCGGFGVGATKVFVFRFVSFCDLGEDGGYLRLFCLLKGLREGRLARSRGAAVRADLSPPFTEEVAKFPAGLNGRAEQFFVCRLTFSFVLAQAEEHFGQGPASFEEGVRLPG